MKAVNLLPSDLRGAPKASAAITARQDAPRGPGAFIVLGALAFGVLALAGYVLTSNSIKDRQSQLTQLQAAQKQAEQRVTALKPFAEFDQLAKGRVATLKDLASRRFDWDQTLRDLSRALPEDVTIKNLSGSLGGATSTSSAPSGQAITTPSITLSGCTRNQKSVARMMARLATVNGVTRVHLASSAKSEAATAASTAAPATGSIGGAELPCGEGARPDFSIAIDFGKASAASAPAAAPAAGATSPATAAAAGATPAPAATPASSATTTTAATGGTK
jgi:Tfp pilus assembly protein PilN